jgi:isopenicillin N synthase-like dioxygenase
MCAAFCCYYETGDMLELITKDSDMPIRALKHRVSSQSCERTSTVFFLQPAAETTLFAWSGCIHFGDHLERRKTPTRTPTRSVRQR